MTGHLIGTSGDITARHNECVESISRLGELPVVDAKTIAQLRRQLGSELATLVVSVAALQPKARKKFGPGVWWVTERSLQQATAWQVARLKSSWLGDRTAYDLCCGVGGDAMQFATRGSVVAVDCDPTLVEMVAANLAHSGAVPPRARVICGEATMIAIPDQAAVHIDPDRRDPDRRVGDRRVGDRRVDGRRSCQPDYYQPAWSDLLRIIAKTKHAVVKLAPVARIDVKDVPGSHQCWLSLGGSVREQSLLCGLATELSGLPPNARSAVSLASDGSASWFLPATNDLGAAKADVCPSPREVLVDPDAAIRAAGLTEAFARKYCLAILGSPSGYLTCNETSRITSSVSPLAVTGRVIWSGSCDDRKLRKELRARGVYPAVIKVRGTDHNPGVLAKRYRKCGNEPVTLWIGRSGSGAFAAFTQPLDH